MLLLDHMSFSCFFCVSFFLPVCFPKVLRNVRGKYFYLRKRNCNDNEENSIITDHGPHRFLSAVYPNQSQRNVTTDGQSASLSLCQAPIWGPRPDFYYCQTVAGLLMWGVLSDERTGLSFTVAAVPRQRSHIYRL
jgi:hypothetical protein